MLDQLILHNFPSGHTPLIKKDASPFVLSTCQRTLVLHHQDCPLEDKVNVAPQETKAGKDAYLYLLEIICGLKSKLVGESEIVSQFKTAYKDYVVSPQKESTLLQILEKLFKDAKDIRSNYLMGLTHKTYASIARKQITSKYKAKEVLILGSGQLAEDLINQFKKKAKVFLCARNQERVTQLSKLHDIEILPWNKFELIKAFPFIVNSIGFKGTLFDNDFFLSWSSMHDKKLFIDLGSPSAIQTTLNYDLGVMKLDDVFREGAIHETQKKKQITNARKALDQVVEKRHIVFQNKLNRTKANYV